MRISDWSSDVCSSDLAIAKVLPLLMFVGIGAMYVYMSLATPLAGPIPLDDLGRAALLLLFAYAGFENLPAAAGEYSNPRRDVPFAMLMMIASVRPEERR